MVLAAWTRTRISRFKKPLLCQLSYASNWPRRVGSNHWPSGLQPDALPTELLLGSDQKQRLNRCAGIGPARCEALAPDMTRTILA